MGRGWLRSFRRQVDIVDDPVVQRYVATLGQRLLHEARDIPEGMDFTFGVEGDETVNAVTLPGGNIFVTTGLLRALETEAQRAEVLGHESAHAVERHVAERLITS